MASYRREFLNEILNIPRYCYGLWRLSRLKKPIVTIFGGKHTAKEHFLYEQAFKLAKKFAEQNISVITGGGPGIMEAALCGAFWNKDKTLNLGIGVLGVDNKFISSCATATVFIGDFASRKKLLILFSQALIAFPGGIGTLDEICEVINLIKLNKIDRIPVILIDTKYWQPFLAWYKKAVEEKYIVSDIAEDLFFATDDINEAFNCVIKSLKKKTN